MRIFAPDDRYGDAPRTSPTGSPFSIADFPRRGDEVQLWFGTVPDSVREASRLRDAIRPALLEQLFMRSPEDDFATRVEERVSATQLGFEDAGWYITLTLERGFTVSDSDLQDGYMWAMSDACRAADETLRREAPAAFDLVVAAIASIVEPALFMSAPSDLYFLTADQRQPTFIPQFGGGGKASWKKSIEGFPTAQLEQRLAELTEHGADWQAWLRKVAYWHQAMLHTDDAWKAFQWGFLALEILTHKLFARLRSQAVAALHMDRPQGEDIPERVIDALLWSKDRTPIASRFALISAYLTPETCEKDFALFSSVKAVRDAIAHGEPVELDALPIAALKDILFRYLAFAFTLQ